MENNPPNVLKFASFLQSELPQHSIVNKDGSTIYVYEAKLIRLLSEAFQAQYEIFTPPDNAVGIRQPDGNWSGILGMTVRSEVDLAMGRIFLTEERYQAVNYAFPHSLSRMTFMTQRPQPVSKNMAIFHPFSYEVWAAISVLFAAVALLFYVLINRKISLQRVVLMTAGSMLEQSLDFKMKTNALRLLSLTWIMGVMILILSYKAVLLSFLSFPTLIGIRDISDLSRASTDGSIKCFTVRGSYLIGYLLKSENAGWKAIADCLNRNEEEAGEIFEAFPKSTSRKVFVGSSGEMSSYANDYFVSEDSFSIVMGGIVFSKKFCCPDRLNSIVYRLVDSGICTKIMNDNDFLFRLQLKSLESDVSEKARKMRLEDLLGAFYILVSGWVLSFTVLFAEILLVKYLSRNN